MKHDYQKAYEVFKDTMREGDYILAVKSALEKQIPKKPIKKNPICYEKTVDGQETYAYDYYCPTCDTNVNNEKHHCPCGQALDWSDTE